MAPLAFAPKPCDVSKFNTEKHVELYNINNDIDQS
jgi:hypothetical protein